MRKKIYLTYDPKILQDGYCAQLQRQIGLIAIAKRFKLSFFLTNIENITITPMDGNESEIDAQNFIRELNNKFFKNFPVIEVKFNKIINLPTPTLKSFLKIYIRSFISKGKILISISNPSGIIEKFPKSYFNAARSLITISKSENNCKHIVAHIRMPINLNHVVPGESFTRYLSESYYVSIIQDILESRNFQNSYRITILTDAPESDLHFNVIETQRDKYAQYNYLIKDNSILVQGHNFQVIKNIFNGKVTIIRGGDLYEAIEIMAGADYFIMSRSSMSFIGAMLNSNGKVFYPPNFWHKPLSNWIKTEN